MAKLHLLSMNKKNENQVRPAGVFQEGQNVGHGHKPREGN